MIYRDFLSKWIEAKKSKNNIYNIRMNRWDYIYVSDVFLLKDRAFEIEISIESNKNKLLDYV